MLERTKTVVAEERSSSKAPMAEAEVKALLARVSTVVVAKGKAKRTLAASEASPDDLRGPTGNFRAPMVRKGKTLLVGFAPAELEKLLGG